MENFELNEIYMGLRVIVKQLSFIFHLLQDNFDIFLNCSKHIFFIKKVFSKL